MVGEEVMRGVFSLFLLLLIFGGLCQAQSTDQEKPPERMIQLSLPRLGGQALESAVDPSEYILGPGDGLVVNHLEERFPVRADVRGMIPISASKAIGLERLLQDISDNLVMSRG